MVGLFEFSMGLEVEPEHTTLREKEKKEARGSKRKTKSFKDEEYYISSLPANQHWEAGLSVRAKEGFGSSRLEAAVLDLVADDSAGLQKQKSVFHWDKRSKKYIKLNNGERVTASGKIKTESGSKVKASKTGIYKKWKERSHNKISFKGTNAEGSAEDARGVYGDRRIQGSRKFKGSQRHRSLPNAHVPSELKNPEQVRKERQKKADKISYMKSKSAKGRKMGKSGKRGKQK